MKKEKSKSENKKAKKELEDKLVNAFTDIVAEYGKSKKTKSIIEKFAKQLSKKVELVGAKDVVKEPAQIAKTEDLQVKNAAKPKAVKKAVLSKK